MKRALINEKYSPKSFRFAASLLRVAFAIRLVSVGELQRILRNKQRPYLRRLDVHALLRPRGQGLPPPCSPQSQIAN